MSHIPLDVAVSSLAARQHGLVTTRQALDLGLTERMVRHRLSTGRWLRVERGVHRLAGAPFTWEARLLGLCLATGGVASHRSAAVLWGLGDVRPGVPEVTIRRGRSSRLADARVHESRDLDERAAVRREGIPTTPVARTLLDLGAVCAGDVVERAVFDAIDRRLTTWSALDETLITLARRGRSGSAALRAVVEDDAGTSAPSGSLELRLDRLLREWGLPRPVRQLEVVVGGGARARLDFAWPDARLAVETDGRSVHARRAAFDADHARRNRLRLAGWELLVYTHRHLRDAPEEVRSQISGALRRRRAA